MPEAAAEEPSVHNELAGPVSGQFVQAGHVSGGVHFHAPLPTSPPTPPPAPPPPLDLWLVFAGVVGVTGGLGALVLVAPSLQFGGPPPLFGTGVVELGSRRPLMGELPVTAYLAFSLLWSAIDLVSRRAQARGRDRLAGRAALWLSIIPAFGALTFTGELSGVWAVLFVSAAVAATIAVLRVMSGGFRARRGIAVAAGVGAGLWFVPEVSLLWTLGRGPILWRVVGTVILLGIVAVPVLVALVGPADRGARMLRSWVWGLVVKLVLGLIVYLSADVGPDSSFVLTLVLPACAVVVMLVAAALLTGWDTRVALR